MNVLHNNEAANQYFLNRMEKIFVDRGVYKVVETFAQYLNHRYRNNCYEYSGTAIIGMKPDDYLVRGSLTLSDDWMWENGGYGHGWVEFVYNGEEVIFDSRCKGIVPKKEWYEEFKPQDIVKFTKKQVLDTIFTPERVKTLQDGTCQCNSDYDEHDSNHIFNPFRNAKIYITGMTVKKFIAFKEFCN